MTQDSEKIAPGWQKRTLEEVVSASPGFWGIDKPSESTRETIVLGVGNVMNTGGLRLEGTTRRYLRSHELSAIAEEGDLLVVKSSGSAANIRSGKTAICPRELSGKIACSNFMLRLRVKRNLANPYLLWLILNSESAKKFIRDIVGASTYPNIKWANYRRFEFALPSLEKQQRIAARLREQLSILAEARAALEAQLKAAAALPAANLRSVFESEEAKRWRVKRLGDLGEIVGGIQKTPSRVPVKFHKAFLTVRNVQRGYLDLSKIERFEVTPEEFERCRLMVGDLLIVEGNGSIDQIGRNALFREDGEWIHQNHIIRVRLERESLSPAFVSAYLNSAAGRAQLIEKARTTTGLYTLSAGKIAQLEIPMPPAAEQNAVAKKLDLESSMTRLLHDNIQSKIAELEKLPAALLHSAFSPNGN